MAKFDRKRTPFRVCNMMKKAYHWNRRKTERCILAVKRKLRMR